MSILKLELKKNILKNLKSSIGRNVNNILGWNTKRKIVVIESDDWGSIRMPSKEVYNFLLKKGYKVDECPFTRFDSLASESDLTLLFDLLKSHKNREGKNPVITANTIVANPDFTKIRESNFTQYYYEDFTKTLKGYPEHSASLSLMKKGIKENVFYPQLHGREHTYVKRWMEYLALGDRDVKLAFDLRMSDVLNETLINNKKKNYREAFDYEDESEIKDQKIILADAQKIFHSIFEYTSKSFIAPNYTWSPLIELGLKEVGIDYIQSSRGQILPKGKDTRAKFTRHFIGEVNNSNQLYLVRNCIFEPSVKPNDDVVSDCLKQINTSFRWNKPAIISTHRLNYIGFIDEANRTRGLTLLNDLLTKIIKKWPEVEFLTSDQLGDIIYKSKGSPSDL